MDIHIFDDNGEQVVVHDRALQEHIKGMEYHEDSHGWYVSVCPSEIESCTIVSFRGGIHKGVLWNHIPIPGHIRVEATAMEGDSFQILSCRVDSSPLSVKVHTKSDPDEGRFKVYVTRDGSPQDS